MKTTSYVLIDSGRKWRQLHMRLFIINFASLWHSLYSQRYLELLDCCCGDCLHRKLMLSAQVPALYYLSEDIPFRYPWLLAFYALEAHFTFTPRPEKLFGEENFFSLNWNFSALKKWRNFHWWINTLNLLFSTPLHNGLIVYHFRLKTNIFLSISD